MSNKDGFLVWTQWCWWKDLETWHLSQWCTSPSQTHRAWPRLFLLQHLSNWPPGCPNYHLSSHASCTLRPPSPCWQLGSSCRLLTRRVHRCNVHPISSEKTNIYQKHLPKRNFRYTLINIQVWLETLLVTTRIHFGQVLLFSVSISNQHIAAENWSIAQRSATASSGLLRRRPSALHVELLQDRPRNLLISPMSKAGRWERMAKNG